VQEPAIRSIGSRTDWFVSIDASPVSTASRGLCRMRERSAQTLFRGITFPRVAY